MNPLHKFIQSRKGDLSVETIVVIICGLLVVAVAVGFAMQGNKEGGKVIDRANSCEAFSGVCLAYCTDAYPALTGGGKGLGCQNKTVCCQANRDDQVVVKYRVDGEFTFHPLDLNTVARVPKGKKIFLQFWVENPKQAGYCTFTKNFGTPDSIMQGGVAVNWADRVAPELAATLPGVCPEEEGTYFSIDQGYLESSSTSPRAFSVQVLVYQADPGTLASGSALYVKRFLAGFQEQ